MEEEFKRALVKACREHCMLDADAAEAFFMSTCCNDQVRAEAMTQLLFEELSKPAPNKQVLYHTLKVINADNKTDSSNNTYCDAGLAAAMLKAIDVLDMYQMLDEPRHYLDPQITLHCSVTLLVLSCIVNVSAGSSLFEEQLALALPKLWAMLEHVSQHKHLDASSTSSTHKLCHAIRNLTYTNGDTNKHLHVQILATLARLAEKACACSNTLLLSFLCNINASITKLVDHDNSLNFKSWRNVLASQVNTTSSISNCSPQSLLEVLQLLCQATLQKSSSSTSHAAEHSFEDQKTVQTLATLLELITHSLGDKTRHDELPDFSAATFVNVGHVASCAITAMSVIIDNQMQDDFRDVMDHVLLVLQRFKCAVTSDWALKQMNKTQTESLLEDCCTLQTKIKPGVPAESLNSSSLQQQVSALQQQVLALQKQLKASKSKHRAIAKQLGLLQQLVNAHEDTQEDAQDDAQ